MTQPALAASGSCAAAAASPTDRERPPSAAGPTGPAYDAAGLSSIRAVRGGGSVPNGPGALAGTIEMSSRSDAGVSGEIDGGSRQSLDAQGRAGLAIGSSVLSLS